MLRSGGMNARRLIPIVAIILAASARPAHAQVNSRFAAGVDFVLGTSDAASNEDSARTVFLPEPLWRFGRVDRGWGPKFALNWYAVDIERPVGGVPTTLGELHIRPIMGGYGYNWTRGRNSVSVNLLGGFAFASMSLSDSATAAYQTRLGQGVADAEASNIFVVRPELDFWHDINRLFGLNVNVGYIVARPDVTIITSAGADTRTARADQFQLRVGLVYSIF